MGTPNALATLLPSRSGTGVGLVRLLAVCSLGVAATLGCKSFKEGYDAKFKESFAKNFADSCTQGAVKAGGQESRVKPLCECIGTYVVGHHTTTELTKMSDKADSPETKAIVEDAARACKPAHSAILTERPEASSSSP